ncbi:hypothetical protein [Methylobacterium haplocladii]|uniref:Uncharacterized protein n=1 Tax=Methylobacterium haplocladii TaxID=1176176 RepID=A0A512IS68_9HYPH|nr:hypothetical protein [Methylobacterium haplocladii]GEP00552.1 hypothetical protein MHA02_29390 [Methylobacterium haplocladii]GJD85465.1 hypothetical protein HPGCJGGD_3354 [Methylobacterium haplocladii]GLS57852.1 hypothetical protein GCM10007887_05080 [Methylobacterium haplocladii]
MSAAIALSPEQQVVAAWRAGVLSLSPDRIPCPGFIWTEPGPRGRTGVWTAVHRAMLAFLDEWGEEAVRLGWDTNGLFGVHRAAGALRVDSTGALVTVYPHRVVAMTGTEIVLGRKETRSTFRGVTNPGDAIPLWEFKGVHHAR